MKKMLFEVGLYPEAVITAQLSEERAAASSSMARRRAIDLHGQVVSKDAVLTVPQPTLEFAPRRSAHLNAGV